MNSRLKSTLFLMEQLIVILIFAFCSAVCVDIFVDSYLMTLRSKDKTGAILAAESCAETFKAVNGDMDKASEILEGVVTNGINEMKVFYDKNWQACPDGDAAYTLTVTAGESRDNSPTMETINIVNHRGEDIVSFTVAVRRDAQ